MWEREVTPQHPVFLVFLALLAAMAWIVVTRHTAATLKADEDQCKRDYRFLHAYTDALGSIDEVMDAVPKRAEIRSLVAQIAGTKIEVLTTLAQDKPQHDLIDVLKTQVGIFARCDGRAARDCIQRAGDLGESLRDPWREVQKGTAHCDRFHLP